MSGHGKEMLEAAMRGDATYVFIHSFEFSRVFNSTSYEILEARRLRCGSAPESSAFGGRSTYRPGGTRKDVGLFCPRYFEHLINDMDHFNVAPTGAPPVGSPPKFGPPPPGPPPPQPPPPPL